MKVIIEVVQGPEGCCLNVVDDSRTGHRIAGPKPWGGGKVIHSFKAEIKDVQQALDWVREQQEARNG